MEIYIQKLLVSLRKVMGRRNDTEQGDNFADTHERITIFKKYLPLIAIFPLMFIVYFFIEYQSKAMLIYLVSLCSSIWTSLYIDSMRVFILVSLLPNLLLVRL